MFVKGRSGNPTGRKKGSTNALTHEMRALARNLLTREYWLSVRKRLTAGELPPGLEAKLWEYAYGAPDSGQSGSGVTVNIGFLTSSVTPGALLPFVTTEIHNPDAESAPELASELSSAPQVVLLDVPPNS